MQDYRMLAAMKCLDQLDFYFFARFWAMRLPAAVDLATARLAVTARAVVDRCLVFADAVVRPAADLVTGLRVASDNDDNDDAAAA